MKEDTKMKASQKWQCGRLDRSSLVAHEQGIKIKISVLCRFKLKKKKIIIKFFLKVLKVWGFGGRRTFVARA